jgi:hypothetical protein
MGCGDLREHDDVAQNHWSECGRAASLAKSDALGRPHRSVLAFIALASSAGTFEQEATESTELESILCSLCYLLLIWESGPLETSFGECTHGMIK